MAEHSKVFGVGLPRTGTTSLNEALGILGFRSLHHPLRFRLQSFRNRYRFDENNWDALTNFGEHCYPELDRAYPESKFILTLRSREDWLDSVRSLCSYPPDDPFHEACRAHIFGRQTFDKIHFARLYENHKKDVINYFKARKECLLVLRIDARDPWKRLCAFLNRPIPSQPFPHAYTRKEFRHEKRIKRIFSETASF